MTTVTKVQLPAPSVSVAPVANWWPLAVLMAGTFVFVLDFFIVNVALPSIQQGLHAGAGALEWVVAGYGLTTAVFLVTGGRLGDIWGRRRIFGVGLAWFVATSGACALATSPGILVAARMAQGLGAALMAPNILSLLGVVYTEERRVRAIAVYGMVMGLAATCGQLIGGILIRGNIAGLGWRAVFWINVPIGIAALAFAGRLIPESRAERAGRLDLTGVGLLTAGLVALVLPLVEGRQQGWPDWSWACLAASPLILGVFVAHQRRTARHAGEPLLDPATFASRTLRAGLGTQSLFWCQQAASYLFLALYLQSGRGLAALQSGAVFAVLAAGYLVTSVPAPTLTVRFGRDVILVGALVAAIGDLALWAAVGGGQSASVALLFPGLFLVGAGQGLCITPLTAIVLSEAAPEIAGSVSGALSTMQQVGNAVGVAVLGVVFFGALGHGYGPAFEQSLLAMSGLLVAVAALTRLLPRPAATS